METLESVLFVSLIGSIYPLVLYWKSRKQNISFIEAYYKSAISWRILYAIYWGMIFCAPIPILMLSTTMLDQESNASSYNALLLYLTFSIILGGSVTRFLQFRYLAQKRYKSIMDVYYDMKLVKRITLGVLYACFFSIPIIWLIMSNSFYGEILMEIEPSRFIGRVCLRAFASGLIFGGGITLLLNKRHNESNRPAHSQGINNTTDGKIQQISNLKKLLDVGALTEEEYNIEKAKILHS